MFTMWPCHDGQPIPKLVGHLLHLLGHTTEFRPFATTDLASMLACTEGGLYKEATNKVNFTTLA